jgi:hypothetical protein
VRIHQASTVSFDTVLGLFWHCTRSLLTLYWVSFDTILGLFWHCTRSLLTLC